MKGQGMKGNPQSNHCEGTVIPKSAFSEFFAREFNLMNSNRAAMYVTPARVRAWKRPKGPKALLSKLSLQIPLYQTPPPRLHSRSKVRFAQWGFCGRRPPPYTAHRPFSRANTRTDCRRWWSLSILFPPLSSTPSAVSSRTVESYIRAQVSERVFTRLSVFQGGVDTSDAFRMGSLGLVPPELTNGELRAQIRCHSSRFFCEITVSYLHRQHQQPDEFQAKRVRDCKIW